MRRLGRTFTETRTNTMTALTDHEFRYALGDQVLALCELLDIPDPTKMMRLEVSVDGLKIEYGDRDENNSLFYRSVHRPGPVRYRSEAHRFADEGPAPAVIPFRAIETVADPTEPAPTERPDADLTKS